MAKTEMVEVATKDELVEDGRKIVAIDGLQIGLFLLEGEVFALENRCVHQGGPICQGKIIGQVLEEIDEKGRSVRMSFSDKDINIACPWHGYEYNIRTGIHPGDPSIRLRTFKTKVEGDKVFVELPVKARAVAV